MSCKEIWIDILIPLICAAIGGGLTLLGVWLTIRHENKKNRNNQKLMYKPYLSVSRSDTKDILPCKEHLPFDNVDNAEHFFIYKIDDVNIANSSNAECMLKEIIIDGVGYALDDNFLSKNGLIKIQPSGNFLLNKINHISDIQLTAVDILENKYYYKCSFKIKRERDNCIMRGKKETGNIFEYHYIITGIGLPKEHL